MLRGFVNDIVACKHFEFDNGMLRIQLSLISISHSRTGVTQPAHLIWSS